MSKFEKHIDGHKCIIHLCEDGIVYGDMLSRIIEDRVHQLPYCFDEIRNGKKIVYVLDGSCYNIYVYNDKERSDVPRYTLKVADYTTKYFVDLFSLFKMTHGVKRWFKNSKDEYFVMKSMLLHDLNNDLVKVVVNREDTALGYISVNLEHKYDDYIPALNTIHDKDSVTRYIKDTTMLHQIASGFVQYYDCYCKEAICDSSTGMTLLLNSVMQELHSRGYYSLALWVDSDRNLDVYTGCGFELDSEFYSKILTSNTNDDGFNAVRYIYNM